MLEEQEQGPEFFDDDGTQFNPDLIPKPSLCTSCRKDGDPKEEILCALNRLAHQDEEGEFVCDAYEPKDL